MGPWMLPSQWTNCQSCLLCIPDGLSRAYAEKGGLAVQEGKPHARSWTLRWRIPDRWVRTMPLCDLHFLLFVSRACCSRQLTCALIQPGGN